MPFEQVKVVAGVDTNRTPVLNEAAISFSQLIRYMPDQNGILVQKLGGWAKYYPNQIGSMVRALWPWNDQNGVSHLAVGADEQLGVITSGVLDDITPNVLEVDVPLKFETTAGSALVTVTDGANYVFATTAATGNGTTATITFSGSHIFQVGASINVFGVTPTGFNGNHIVTASTANTVSYLSTATGPQTIAGTVQNQSATTVFDSVYVKTPVTVGGLTIFGLYDVTPLTANTYTIVARDVFGVATPAVYSTTSKTTTVTSGSGTVATLTYAASYVFPVGTQVTVAGVTPTGYNGPQIVTGGSATTVTYASTTTGAMSVAGTITNYGGLAQFSMTENNSVVTVTFYNHGLQVGDSYGFVVPTIVNGVELVGEYSVASVVNSYQFTIRLGTAPSSATTTAATGTGATATLTFATGSGNYAFRVGASITVSGVSPAGYNGTYTVTAATATTVSYANTTTAAQTVAGSIWVADTYIPQNDQLVQLEYYIGQSTTSSGAGFGVGGFGAGGFGVGTAPAPVAGVPIVTTDYFLDNWGSILIALPILDVEDDDTGGPIYMWNPIQSTPNASVIAAGPLKSSGIFVAMPQRQIVAWGSTFDGIQDHLLIRWCDVENFNDWVAQPQNQAGSYRLPRGSRIVGGMQGPQQGYIWTDIALWSMQYIGQPYVYSFNEIATGCGLISPKAVGMINGVTYWMSQSQFFRMTGDGVEMMPCPLWDTIFQQLDADNLDHIRCAPNSRFGEISWFIPITGSDGENGFCVKYNTITNQWDYSVTPLTRSAWTNQSILGAPIGAGTDQYIYQHESMNGETLLNADTQAMESSFRTGYFTLSEGTLMMYVDQFWPDMKWGLYGGTQSANVKFTFYVLDMPNGTPVQYGPYTVTQATQYFTPRFRGRLVAFEISSSDINSFWRMGANRYRSQPDGKF